MSPNFTNLGKSKSNYAKTFSGQRQPWVLHQFFFSLYVFFDLAFLPFWFCFDPLFLHQLLEPVGFFIKSSDNVLVEQWASSLFSVLFLYYALLYPKYPSHKQRKKEKPKGFSTILILIVFNEEIEFINCN